MACVATLLMLFWPLMRFFPAQTVNLLGARRVIFIEVTGIVVPATLLFAIAIRHVRTAGERRALCLLIGVCCLYLAYHGQWMIGRGVPDLRPTRLSNGICRQSTGYTCVAASLVTLLEAYGYHATETEMARLSHTIVGDGTTDSRATAALEEKLAGELVKVCFEDMNYERLKAVPKPCVVSLKWSYFVSHMVPVMSADDQEVRVGDPLGDRPNYKVKDFLEIWHKCGIFLVDRRQPTGSRP